MIISTLLLCFRYNLIRMLTNWFAVFKVKVTIKAHSTIKIRFFNDFFFLSTRLLILLQSNFDGTLNLIISIVFCKRFDYCGQGHCEVSKLDRMFVTPIFLPSLVTDLCKLVCWCSRTLITRPNVKSEHIVDI